MQICRIDSGEPLAVSACEVGTVGVVVGTVIADKKKPSPTSKGGHLSFACLLGKASLIVRNCEAPF